jgi:hypothetical protein
MRTLLILAVAASMVGAGCKKKTMSSASVATTGPATDSNYDPGQGTVHNVRGAVQRKAVESNQMKQIHIFIENASGASGKMPSQADVLAAIKQEAPHIAALISDGTIVINNARSRDEVWAYEAKALETKGWVVTSSGVENMDADTLKSRLNK